jgi:phospholipid transport system substrate-binding protein
MKRVLSAVGLMCAVSLWTISVVAMEAPLDTVKSTTEQVLERVRADKDGLRANPAKMYSLVSQFIFPHFDFNVMSQFVLGEQWKSAPELKRTAFVEQFRKLLVRTYATALLEYSDQKINYPADKNGTANGKTATVTQLVSHPSGGTLPIVYRMHSKAGPWMVFDVSVDGVSLVKTYRSSFTSVLQDGGIDKLIANLSEKNKEIGQ